MKNLLTRSITGILYVCLLLAAVYLNTDAFDFLFMIFGLACLYEFKRIVDIKGYLIFTVYLFLWWLYIYFFNYGYYTLLLLIATIVVDLFLLYFLFSKRAFKFNQTSKSILGIFYLGGGCIFLTMAPYQEDTFVKLLITGIFVIVWVNDSFAYLTGTALGRNKLFPSVSPKKTIEGAIGGFVFALLASYLIAQYDQFLSLNQWLIIATLLVVFGNLGDLVESKFKRIAQIKDSGAILPGHGGILDRLDSLVFAAPFVYLFIMICNYVS